MQAQLTVGQIAKRLGVSRAKVDYAVSKHNIIERSRAGIFRMYGEDQLGVIQAALDTVRTRAAVSAGS